MKSLLLALLVAAPAAAQTVAPPVPPAPYLTPGAVDVTQIIQAAPVVHEPRYDADRKIFKQTRKAIGTPRYALATSDVDYTVPAMARDFSCAAGVVLTRETAPRLTLLIVRAGRDTARISAAGKDSYKRLRPYQIDKGKTCQAPAELVGSFDYPSGHSTWGWTWGTILAELMPDRASAIEARARAYGESRVICGVHNASAVEAGRATATGTLSVVRASLDYQADFAAARAELAALRASGPAPDAAACATEAGLIAQHGY